MSKLPKASGLQTPRLVQRPPAITQPMPTPRPTGVPRRFDTPRYGAAGSPGTPGTKQISSTTKVTVNKGGTPKTICKAGRTTLPKDSPSTTKRLGATIGASTSKSAVPIPPPSVLRKQVALQVKSLASQTPMGSKITAVGAKKSTVPPLKEVMTPKGPQQVIQKIVTEKRVERSKFGEVVSKNIKTIGTDPKTGETVQIEQEVQKMNPDFPLPKGPVKEIVSVVSERNITQSFDTTTENVVRETTKLDPGIGMDAQKLLQLVEEEKEDVQNALRINPPELVNQSPDKFPLRKRLQVLRLSPENVALLEQSVMQPPISADEPLPEPSPEVMVKIMDAMDKSIQPKMDPESTFNSIFVEASQDEPMISMMTISSIAPGPLNDVVIPVDSMPEIIQEEMLSKQMEEASIIVQTAEEKPPNDSYALQTPVQPKKKTRPKWERQPMLTEELPPWAAQDLPDVSIAIGALPTENLDVTDVFETTISGHMNEEIEKGIEYYLECNPLQYSSTVQLRGSQLPSWFPGYIFALTDMADGVEVAKSPSQVLFSAWKSVQPEIFPEDSIAYN